MKLVKILLKTVLWIVAIVIVALLTLPLWFGPVVKTAANSVVPGIVKTDFHLGHLSLNPYTCRFELGDLQLANPAGYLEKYAATVGDIAFDADTLSLATDVIHIEEIKVKDIFVSYVSGGTGEEKVNNFQQIQYNIAGGKEKYEQAKAEKAKREPEPKAEEKPAKSKKLIIDRLEISGLVVQLGILPIRVPSITLTDLGKKSGGATLTELGQEIWNGILKAAGNVGEAIGEMAGQATEAANKAAAQATEAAGQATKAVGDAAGQATKALGDAANKAGEAGGKADGDAAIKAGEAAGKALDSLKKLW